MIMIDWFNVSSKYSFQVEYWNYEYNIVILFLIQFNYEPLFESLYINGDAILNTRTLISPFHMHWMILSINILFCKLKNHNKNLYTINGNITWVIYTSEAHNKIIIIERISRGFWSIFLFIIFQEVGLSNCHFYDNQMNQ